jgi:hypothetical protein
MPLPDAQLDDLRELLKRCVARVVPDGGGSHGTGFFIADRLLLTCAHVVKGGKGAMVTVQPFQREERGGTVLDAIADKGRGDIALVEVMAINGEEKLPAVALHHAIGDQIPYLAVGFPRERIAEEGGIEAIGYNGHASTANDGSVILLKLDSGKGTVGSGMSGGPVMNAETGAVVAIVQSSEGTSTDAGGSAIPITRAASAFSRVGELLAESPFAAACWRSKLGPTAWETLGKVWEPRQWVDVVVDGSACRWRVKVGIDEADGLEITAGHLPDEISEALFHWSQRRHVRDSNEVKLLGRLLAGAVFPSEVADRIKESSSAAGLLVRLRIDGSSDLFDVPWEFVTVPGNDDVEYLAAVERCGFVRVAPHPNEAQIVLSPTTGPARVVGIVVHPAAWQKFMPRLGDAGAPTAWPRVGQVAQELQKDIEGLESFTFTPLTDAKPFTLQAALPPKSADAVEVVHYIGFGRYRDGNAEMAFGDDYDAVTWRDAKDFFGWVAQSGARLLVVQFVLPRYDIDSEPVPPRAFLSALSNRVNAVVFTRFPVHPQQSHTFNAALYRVLADGEPIEVAVQRARTEVAGNQFLGDAAGFGSFTLVTGPKSDMRIVAAKSPDPFSSGRKQNESTGLDREPEINRRVSDNMSFTRL